MRPSLTGGSIRANLQLGVNKKLRSSRRVCHVPCCGLCRLTFPSPSVRAVRFPAITTGRGSVILRPHPNHHLKRKRRFPHNLGGVGGPEWSGLSNSFVSKTSAAKARAPDLRTAGSHVHHTPWKRRFFFHSRSDLEKVGRHHHHAHTPHLRTATCIPSFFFFRTRCPQNSTGFG